MFCHTLFTLHEYSYIIVFRIIIIFVHHVLFLYSWTDSRNALALWVNVLFEILVLDKNFKMFYLQGHWFEFLNLSIDVCWYSEKTSQTHFSFTFRSLDEYILNIYHVRSFHVHIFSLYTCTIILVPFFLIQVLYVFIKV